jgi:hypothetical protein
VFEVGCVELIETFFHIFFLFTYRIQSVSGTRVSSKTVLMENSRKMPL